MSSQKGREFLAELYYLCFGPSLLAVTQGPLAPPPMRFSSHPLEAFILGPATCLVTHTTSYTSRVSSFLSQPPAPSHPFLAPWTSGPALRHLQTHPCRVSFPWAHPIAGLAAALKSSSSIAQLGPTHCPVSHSGPAFTSHAKPWLRPRPCSFGHHWSRPARRPPLLPSSPALTVIQAGLQLARSRPSRAHLVSHSRPQPQARPRGAVLLSGPRPLQSRPNHHADPSPVSRAPPPPGPALTTSSGGVQTGVPT